MAMDVVGDEIKGSKTAFVGLELDPGAAGGGLLGAGLPGQRE